MTKKILIVLSEWGYWGEELLAPLETFDAAGYEVTFATPKGKRPHALPLAWMRITLIHHSVDQSLPREWPARFVNWSNPTGSTTRSICRRGCQRALTGVLPTS